MTAHRRRTRLALGARVNTAAFEYNPVVTRDGATLILGRADRLLHVSLAALGVPSVTPDRFR
ncbi:MAG: hypothetical protein ACJ79S_17450 [Gemmatimonadaceae bacterium]